MDFVRKCNSGQFRAIYEPVLLAGLLQALSSQKRLSQVECTQKLPLIPFGKLFMRGYFYELAKKPHNKNSCGYCQYRSSYDITQHFPSPC